MKKPASKVQKVSEAWKPSPSFGFVKATKATAKSYSVSRGSMKEIPGDSIVAFFSGKPLVGYTFCCL
jgi:hypothetical protein